jgi:hypothetical protein
VPNGRRLTCIADLGTAEVRQTCIADASARRGGGQGSVGLPGDAGPTRAQRS